MSREIITRINRLEQGDKAALVTIIQRAGSAPRKPGTKMLVHSDGRIEGTIGGGCVEAEIRQKALEAMDVGLPIRHRVQLTLDQAEEEGMACGGRIDVFIEPIRS